MLGPIQPSPPSTKELHEMSEFEEKTLTWLTYHFWTDILTGMIEKNTNGKLYIKNWATFLMTVAPVNF